MDSSTQRSTITRRPAAGRPTRAQAQRRHDELLDSALDLFLDKGYQQATIEAIAASVGMTKRTVYALYADKAALFKATVQRAIERMIVTEEALRALQSDDLEATLIAVARMRVARTMTSAGLKLQRIIDTESYRFPAIFNMAYQQGTRPVVEFLAELLGRETAAGRLAVTNPITAARVFLSMVVSGPVRIITSGNRLSNREIEERLQFAVRLFLVGARVRGDSRQQ
jgi:AcrR family transcriptional regulator